VFRAFPRLRGRTDFGSNNMICLVIWGGKQIEYALLQIRFEILEDIMALSSEQKTSVVKKYQRSEGDTGSPEVQVALLSARIDQLSDHFKDHTHDHHSRQGLLKMVSSRRKLLDYLRGKDQSRYQDLITSLGLRR